MTLFKQTLIASAIVLAPVASHAAYDSAGTDYSKFIGNTWTNAGPASDSLGMVNFLICIMNSTNAASHPNETYTALVNEDICNELQKPGKDMATETVVTSRTDNNSPYKISAYHLDKNGAKYVAKTNITSAPTTAAPIGSVYYVLEGFGC